MNAELFNERLTEGEVVGGHVVRYPRAALIAWLRERSRVIRISDTKGRVCDDRK
jgi:hypothetical protein